MGGGTSAQYAVGKYVGPCFVQSSLTAPTAVKVAQKLGRDRLGSMDAVVVTGVTIGGTGYYVAEALALHCGTAVFLCGRSLDKVAAAAAKIREEAARLGRPEAPVLYEVKLDLNCLRSVAEAATAVLGVLEKNHGDELRLLVNNAGATTAKYEQTAQGVEANAGRNYLATHYLTQLLLPALRKAGQQINRAPPRIVHVASIGHALSSSIVPGDLADRPETGGSPSAVVEQADTLRFKGNQTMGAVMAYGRSKLMMVSDARCLARRERDMRVRAVSLHPGSIVSHFGASLGAMAKIYYYGMYPFQYSAAQGAGAILKAALSPEFDGPESPGAAGAYLHCNGAVWRPVEPLGGWRNGDFDEELFNAAQALCQRLIVS